jgi:hypothetical protein
MTEELKPCPHGEAAEELRNLSLGSIYSVADLGAAYDRLHFHTKNKTQALALLELAMDVATRKNKHLYQVASTLGDCV